jgi:mannose-6-phosphate isomerase-like protein (cupin superfamily)
METTMPARQELDIVHDARVSEDGAWFGRSKPIAREEMLSRVFRFETLPSNDTAFVDAVIPGHRRVLMGALGLGTADEKLQHQVKAAENYHIDIIRAEPGNGAALHSHDTEETFVCLTGRWRVTWGDTGSEHVELGYLDGISCPPGVMRSFENVAGETALLLSILGGKHPGHVIWSAAIRDQMVKAYQR